MTAQSRNGTLEYVVCLFHHSVVKFRSEISVFSRPEESSIQSKITKEPLTIFKKMSKALCSSLHRKTVRLSYLILKIFRCWKLIKRKDRWTVLQFLLNTTMYEFFFEDLMFRYYLPTPHSYIITGSRGRWPGSDGGDHNVNSSWEIWCSIFPSCIWRRVRSSERAFRSHQHASFPSGRKKFFEWRRRRFR